MVRVRLALLCVAALCAAVPAFAQEDMLTAVVTSVSEPDAKKLEALLSKAILSPDPRIRAAAARVINVRKVTSLLNHVRARLDQEADGAAAREEIRAAVMLGGVRDLDRALWVSDRFEKNLDDAAALAAAHLGEAGIDAFFTKFQKRHVDVGGFFITAMWGHPELAPGIAMRLLAADKESFQKFLFAIDSEPDELLDTNVFTAALADSDADARTEMVWYLVNRGVTPGEAPFDPKVKDAVDALKDSGDDSDLTVGLELLRRILRLPSTNSAKFRSALADSRLAQLRIFFAPKKLMEYIGEENRSAILGGASIPERRIDANVRPLPFIAPSLMPNGVATAIMHANRCGAGWLGEAMVRVDKSGRVTGSSLEFVEGDAGCKRALQTLLDLSLVDNTYVTSPFETSRVSMAQLANAEPCLDEGIIHRTGVRIFGTLDLRMPRLVRKVDPQTPPRKKAEESLVELVVSRDGCVRTARVIRSIDPTTDRAVLRAVQQWQFEPGHYETGSVETTLVMRVQVK